MRQFAGNAEKVDAAVKERRAPIGLIFPQRIIMFRSGWISFYRRSTLSDLVVHAIRDGVSEGQFAEVAEAELSAIKRIISLSKTLPGVVSQAVCRRMQSHGV